MVMKMFLAKLFCLFPFVYYYKKCHTDKNKYRTILLLVLFSLLLQKVSYEWEYFWCKFVTCSFLLSIAKSIIRIKIILAEIYCFFFLVYYCKKCHTNENISDANLLFLLSCLLLWKVSYEWKSFWHRFIAFFVCLFL